MTFERHPRDRLVEFLRIRGFFSSRPSYSTLLDRAKHSTALGGRPSQRARQRVAERTIPEEIANTFIVSVDVVTEKLAVERLSR